MTRTKGFTLVEILIVVIILGILAAIILPRFSDAATTARRTMLAEDLRVLRTQLGIYGAQHEGHAAGYPVGGGDPDAVTFVDQIIHTTNVHGEVGERNETEFRFGPYFQRTPTNPINQKDTVRILGDADSFPDEATGDSGWIYQPATNRLRADAVGTDGNGRAYYSY